MSFIPRARTLVLTGAVTVITIAGSVYGAQVKMQQEVSQVLFKISDYPLDSTGHPNELCDI